MNQYRKQDGEDDKAVAVSIADKYLFSVIHSLFCQTRQMFRMSIVVKWFQKADKVCFSAIFDTDRFSGNGTNPQTRGPMRFPQQPEYYIRS